MDGVKKVARVSDEAHHASSTDHQQRVQKSSTLNRKFVKKPTVARRMNNSAEAAAKSLRRSSVSAAPNGRASEMLTKKNSVNLRPLHVRTNGASAQLVARANGGNARLAAAAKNANTLNKSQTRSAKTASAMKAMSNAQSQQQQLQQLQARQQAQAQQIRAEQLKLQQAERIRMAERLQRQQVQQMRSTTASSYVNFGALKQQSVKQQPVEQQVVAPAMVQSQQAAKATQQASGEYQRHQMAIAAQAKLDAQKLEPVHMSAREMKDRAIQQALRKMDAMDKQNSKLQDNFKQTKQKRSVSKGRRFAFASAFAVACFAVLGYLAYLNMPDISVRVAAMQAGIERSYPSYVPMSYRLDGLVGEDSGRITMNFKNDKDKTFSLSEEKTAWDSAAVLTNFVKKHWGEDYSIAKGQGLTIYVSGSNAAWVNGGVFYLIEDTSENLSSDDLHDIAVSM